MLDIFDNDAFSLINLTARINKLPEVPTLIGNLNIFEEQGVTTTRVDIERRDESLTLVASSPRGGPGEVVGGETRDIRPINIPHFQRDDSVVADEVQNIRAFGTDNVLETVAGRIDMKMMRSTRSFDFTLENLRLGAIKGIILDKNGGTLLNCYTEFSISEPAAISFGLASSTTDVRAKTRQVLDTIEDALEGEQVSRVIGLCGDEFFHNFVEHDKVTVTYKNWEAAVNLR
ncbi:MAG: major capsid protein, partial [Anaerolineae bacterium]|nr:major capsid protein [Anaerolineae bacterium]